MRDESGMDFAVGKTAEHYERLAAIGKELWEISYRLTDDDQEALEKIAAQTSTTPTRVLVCGSLYLAGAVLHQNEK